MNCNLLGMSLINCHVVLTAKFFERMPNLINFPTGTGLLKIFEDDILTKIWKSQISSGKSGSSYSFQGAQALAAFNARSSGKRNVMDATLEQR